MPLFGRKRASKATRLYYATDIHGSQRTFRKFLNAGKFYNAQVLVMGGDIMGKFTIPIITEGNGKYRATLQGTVHHLESQQALNELIQKIELLGFYHKIMDQEEFQRLQGDEQAKEALIHQLARQRLEQWLELAEERLGGTGIHAYVTGGNDDHPHVLEVLQEAHSDVLTFCENQVVNLDDQHTMISLGFSTPTPWDTPREVSDEELGQMIEQLVAKVPDMRGCVFNFHDPPAESTLDTCPMLDWSTDPPSPIIKAGQMVMHGAGSNAVRRAIEEHQPMLSLHGHIHEASGAIKIGRTLCVNPGSEYGEGILRGCLFNLVDGEVKSYQLTSG